MAWHVAEVAQDISVTVNSTTSYGGIQESTSSSCQRTCRSESWRRQASRWCHAAALGHWHGMSQYQTPMPTHTSLTRRPQQGRQLTIGRQQGGQIQTAGQQPHLRTSCHRVSRDLEPPSSGISTWVGPTNDSRHWRHQGGNWPVPAAVSGSTAG